MSNLTPAQIEQIFIDMDQAAKNAQLPVQPQQTETTTDNQPTESQS